MQFWYRLQILHPSQLDIWYEDNETKLLLLNSDVNSILYIIKILY